MYAAIRFMLALLVLAIVLVALDIVSNDMLKDTGIVLFSSIFLVWTPIPDRDDQERRTFDSRIMAEADARERAIAKRKGYDIFENGCVVSTVSANGRVINRRN